jgi:adenine/guanine phosphoribosyltransferase-like PRPP-binding protein
MDMQEIIKELTGCGTIINGTFLLPDGRICSEWYVPVKAFQYPPLCRKLAYEIVKHFWDMDVQVVIASRVGALPFATEIARQLEARLLWRSNEDSVFYPNLAIHSGDRAIIVDDILLDDITPYKSIGREILTQDARLIGIASLIDLTTKKTPLNVRQISVLKRELNEIDAENPVIVQHRT